MSNKPSLLVLLMLAALVLTTSCASKSELEAVKGEIGFLKGDMEKLKATVAAQAQELKIAQGSMESLRTETRELREAMKTSQEKPQNKSTGAKPKAKKRRR